MASGNSGEGEVDFPLFPIHLLLLLQITQARNQEGSWDQGERRGQFMKQVILHNLTMQVGGMSENTSHVSLGLRLEGGASTLLSNLSVFQHDFKPGEGVGLAHIGYPHDQHLDMFVKTTSKESACHIKIGKNISQVAGLW